MAKNHCLSMLSGEPFLAWWVAPRTCGGRSRHGKIKSPQIPQVLSASCESSVKSRCQKLAPKLSVNGKGESGLSHVKLESDIRQADHFEPRTLRVRATLMSQSGVYFHLSFPLLRT